MSTLHPASTGPWWIATALVTGCAITPAEIDALTEMRPAPVALRAELRDGGVMLTATLPAPSVRAARSRMRTAVSVLLDGFGATIGDVRAVSEDPEVPAQRTFSLRRLGIGRG
ncbi:hypothetical protein EV383_2931 [Pseudonocardia sediminis]|uniref:Uncharacterized protein n=1 Tax=Pseudonocardia sediminis TaxID=1397368 RepID=A0A4Q7V0E5_PSEST|nr:hypothetical protein [Pseudonocardia sediminis]RZT86043.1 hypothetical protein EV383_2931 [Pseudonocardia sediminis]